MFNITSSRAASSSRNAHRVGWLAVLLLAFSTGPATAQPVADDLSDVVGRIALYPDPLIAIVLPASTYPLQVVQAARFLEDYEYDSSLQPNPDWDDAVIALLNYPEVLAMMNEDLDWTWTLGEEVLYDQDGVLDAVQRFRDRAYAAGNLRSDERQVVSRSDTVIEVVPVQPEVIYVPYYEPRRVVVYQPAPVIWYYPRAYPVYYYPYPVDYLFPTRYFWGVTTVFSIGWRTRVVHVHHHHYTGHPFFGRPYHVPYYVRAPQTVTNINIRIDNRRGDVWRPASRGGSRPQTVSRRDSDSRFTVDARDDSRRQTRTDSRRDAAATGSDARATSRTETARTVSGSSRINERFDARVATRDGGRETGVGVRATTTPRSTQPSTAPRSGTPQVTTPRSERSTGTISGRTGNRPATGDRATGGDSATGDRPTSAGRLAAPAQTPQRRTSTQSQSQSQTTQRQTTLAPPAQPPTRIQQPRTSPQAQPRTQPRTQPAQPQSTQRSPSRVTATPNRSTSPATPAAPSAPSADRGSTSRSSTPPARTSNDGRATINRREPSNSRTR